jgi:AbrB family looped-hinge helix DNA binding protein
MEMFKCSPIVKVILDSKMESEIVVKKKGQTTIPVGIRRKLRIEEGTRFEVVITDEGLLLKPKKSIWDMIGVFSQYGTPEEVKKEIDALRQNDE